MKNVPAIEASNLSIEFVHDSSPIFTLGPLSFTVAKGNIFGIIGPSGAGKTTLLRIMSGLITPAKGAAFIEGKKIIQPTPQTVVVFQEYAKSLFPWKTVEQNIRFGLNGIDIAKHESDLRVSEVSRLVGLSEFANEYPWRLSGGMQQRVVLARALVRKPSVLLMDEPLGSVDAQTRYILEDEIIAIVKRFGITVIFVTHDIDEAIYMSDQVAVLSGRPTHIIDVKAVELGWPRNQVSTRSLPLFGKMRGELMELTQKTYEKQNTA